jgi:hypothetical protein
VAHQLILPTAALLSLIGAGVGVHLGNAAISEINPAYLSAEEPRSRFYADLTANRPRDWAAVQVSELQAAESGRSLGTGCVGCRTYPEEYYPVHEASLGKPHTGWAEVSQEAAPAETPQAAEPAVELASVERYAHFPVSAEEELQPAPADPQPAEPPAAE